MTLHFFPVPMLLGLGVLVIVLPLVWLWKRSFASLVVFSIFWVYLLLLVGITLFPLMSPLTGEARRSTAEILSRVNLVPFHLGQAFRYTTSIRTEMFANLLLTIPFGLLLPAVMRVKPPIFLLLAVGVGIGIEMTQLGLSLLIGTTQRITDITDVILNFCGAVIGYLGYLLIKWLLRLFRRVAKDGG